MSKHDEKIFTIYTFSWTVALFAAVLIMTQFLGNGSFVSDFIRIITSPSKLVTDYFEIGSIETSFFNAALCSLSCNIIMLVTKVKPSPNILAGQFLVIAHCFYGLNILNMWPPMLGVIIACRLRKHKFGDYIHIGFFATSLAPFVSDFLFRYTLGDKFVFGSPVVTAGGLALALIFGIAAGALVPALLPGTTKMHRGHNLYKAGLAIGLFGMFAYALFYRSLGVETPDAVVRINPLYEYYERSYGLAVNAFFLIMFIGTFLFGFFENGKSMKGYGKLVNDDGLDSHFINDYSLPVTIMNIGIYGMLILVFYNIVIYFTNGAGFTGVTAGAVIAAITYTSCGQTPKNVYPILLGYTIFFGIVLAITHFTGTEMTWTLSTQAYLSGMAFATGLCPFAGRYGVKVGIIAGILHAILCTSTIEMHGGFVLYNGGFTSGLTAMLLLPVLDYYKVPIINTKHKKLDAKEHL